MNSVIKILVLLLILLSCKPEDPSEDHAELKNGLLVLNEGLFQQNNSSLSMINFETGTHSMFFLQTNGQNLGDVGNDMKRHGGKIYIVMNNSNVVHVLDAENGHLIQSIPFMDGTVGRSPRSIAFDGAKAYVCSFDGSVARIDTSSLNIEAVTLVGRNPEALCVVGSKIYVSNSGGLDFPNYDSTVSVIDLTSFSEIKKINVGINPGKILADAQGDVYVIRRGDYGAVSPRLLKIDTNLDSVVYTLAGIDVLNMEYDNDQLFYSYQNPGGGTPVIGVYNTLSESVENSNWTDLSGMNTLYGMKIDPDRQKMYLMEAHNYSSTGDILVYDLNGNYETRFGVGYLPSNIVIYP